MAKHTGVLDRPPTVTGGGGGRRGTRRGGILGMQGQGGAGGPTDDEIKRLVAMLGRIRDSLNLIVHIEPPAVPAILHEQFNGIWPQVDLNFARAIRYLQRPLNPLIQRELVRAGLTRDMLVMKQVSLNYHLGNLDAAVAEMPIITAPLSQRVSGLERIVKWFKPSAETMNSVLGSLPKAIPGVEIRERVQGTRSCGLGCG
ncbi:MAG: hypothetical protein ACRD40_02830 [Candidatus Acidiferrales bacterium]